MPLSDRFWLCVLCARLTQIIISQWINTRGIWAWSRTTCTADAQLRHGVCLLRVRAYQVSFACTVPSACRHVRFWHQSGSNPKTCGTCEPRSIMFYWHHLKFVQSYQRETVPWLRVSVPILMDDPEEHHCRLCNHKNSQSAMTDVWKKTSVQIRTPVRT